MRPLRQQPVPLSRPAPTLIRPNASPFPRALHRLRPPSHEAHVLCDLCRSLSSAEAEDTVYRHLRFLRAPPLHFCVYDYLQNIPSPANLLRPHPATGGQCQDRLISCIGNGREGAPSPPFPSLVHQPRSSHHKHSSSTHTLSSGLEASASTSESGPGHLDFRCRKYRGSRLRSLAGRPLDARDVEKRPFDLRYLPKGVMLTCRGWSNLTKSRTASRSPAGPDNLNGTTYHFDQAAFNLTCTSTPRSHAHATPYDPLCLLLHHSPSLGCRFASFPQQAVTRSPTTYVNKKTTPMRNF